MDCGLLWCFYQTLILTAPIHCRASIAETLMQCYIFWISFSFCLLQMLTDGLEWCGLLWCFYQTLILTAPIHCRASIGADWIWTVDFCQLLPVLCSTWISRSVKWLWAVRAVTGLSLASLLHTFTFLALQRTNAFQLPQTPKDDWKWEVSHKC